VANKKIGPLIIAKEPLLIHLWGGRVLEEAAVWRGGGLSFLRGADSGSFQRRVDVFSFHGGGKEEWASEDPLPGAGLETSNDVQRGGKRGKGGPVVPSLRGPLAPGGMNYLLAYEPLKSTTKGELVIGGKKSQGKRKEPAVQQIWASIVCRVAI